jgi:lipopolysaccharide export system permease protein
MSIIDRYLIKTVIFSTFLFLLIVLSLYGFIALADSFKYVGRGSFSTGDAFFYTVLTLPRRMYELFPFSVLLGAMMGLGTLNSNSELVAIRAAGVSMARIIFSTMKAALLLGLFMFLVGEYVVPATENMALNHFTSKTRGATSVVTKNAVWIRDKETFTKIHSISANNSLGKVSIFSFNDDHTLRVSTSAQNAQFIDDHWVLNQIKQTFIRDDKIIVNEIDKARWPTLLDLELVDVIVSKLEHLSAAGLFRYASYLDDNNLDSSQYWLIFWNKVISPFSIAAMLLLAVPFVFDSSRTSNAGNRLMLGVLIGVVFTITDKIAAQFGLVYHINPIISASAITLLTFIIASLLIKRMT